MQLNKERLWKEVDATLDGLEKPRKNAQGYRELARRLGVPVPNLHRLLNKEEAKAGLVFMGKLRNYCKEKELDFDEFIQAEETVCKD
ncbi:hypothetical protein [Paenibacillus sp. BK720]|uniref:hypothetical protein n=1 Tax=Paenibacillus sp. BK720 TaxID=2587092 RepID=UPI00141E68FB|nr:hypothetical protein [Paenibacillus sp. BK720]NIK67895.1 putative transcriptional regulator [Paenibacillus sp. BK720]